MAIDDEPFGVSWDMIMSRALLISLFHMIFKQQVACFPEVSDGVLSKFKEDLTMKR